MGVIDGRVAIITGGARGIGASISRLFAKEGAALVINDLGGSPDGTGSDEGPAKQVADEIAAAGGTAVADGGDIGDVATGERLVRTAVEQFGKLDIVVNVAGILRDRMIFNLSEEDWDEVIRVHLKGHYSTVRPASAYWREQRNPAGPLPDHQLHLDLRSGRVPRPAELRGRQDGHRRAHLLARAGAGPLRRHRQRDRAGRGHQAHRDRPGGQARRPGGTALGRGSPATPRTTSRRWPCTWPASGPTG